MEAKRLELFGSEIVLASEKVSTNAVYVAFMQLEQAQRSRVADGFDQMFTDLDGLYERADIVANEIRALAIEEAMKVLAGHGLYEVSEQLFFDRFMDPYDEWDQDFEPIASSYEAMVEHTAELDAYRTARRQNRAKWVGFNERGVRDADAKNLISNVGHGVFNLMAKGVTAISNAIKKDEIFKNPQTLAIVRDGMGNIVTAAREGVIEALNMLKPGSVYLYSQDEIDRSSAIIEHVLKERVPAADRLSALLRAIEAFPYNRDAYVSLLTHGGFDEGRLDSVVEYFGLAALLPEKKQLFEGRRRGVDLSTLEALDVQLPGLIAYSKSIGYTSFFKEAVKLREDAARRAFESRVQILSDASVAEIHAQSDELRTYAKKIGFEGADAVLADTLTKARIRELRQEAAKHPLATPEDFDRILPLLEAHARRIGFEDFENWAQQTRQHLASSPSKKSNHSKNGTIGSDSAKPGVNGKEPAKPMEMVLGFVVIALIAFGVYKAYLSFTQPDDAIPVVAESIEEGEERPVINEASVPVAELHDDALASDSFSAPTSIETSTLKPLSPAAEQAIREGFVDIQDPVVLACTDAKVKAFRKDMGEEAILTYAAYNEFAVACGFNI